MNNDEFDSYLIHKLLESVLFDSDDNDYSDRVWMFDINVLELIKKVVQKYIKSKDLNQYIKDNVNTFLTQARFYKDENYEDRISLINEIIVCMNRAKLDTSLALYRMQLATRRKSSTYIYEADYNDILKEVPYVHESICNDLIVLVSHLDDTSESDFINKYLEGFKDDDYYYENINSILKECPKVFKNLTFYNRFICVLNLKQELNNNPESMKYNKKLVKRINRIAKIKSK